MFPRVRSSGGWCSPAEYFTGFGLGSDFLMYLRRSFWPGFSLFWFLSLESNLLISTGFSKTRTSPWFLPVSSSPIASSHGRASSSCWTRGLHVPERSLPELVRVGHDLSSRARLVVLWWFWGLLANFCCRWGHQWWRVFYMLRRQWRRFPTPIPFLASVLGCFRCFFLSLHSLPMWHLNITWLFLGLGARFALFYLLIVLKCKEWLNVVPLMVLYCFGFCSSQIYLA